MSKIITDLKVDQKQEIIAKYYNYQSEIKLTLEEENYLIKKDTLSIGIEPNYYPYSYFEDDKPKGYFYDILNNFAQETNLELKISKLTYDQQKNALNNKKIDIFLDADKEGMVSFPKTVIGDRELYKYKESIISLVGYKNVNELIGKRVGYISGMEYNLHNVKNIQYIAFDTEEDLIDALIKKNIDGAIASYVTLNFVIKKKNLTNVFTNYPIVTSDKISSSFAAVHKDNKILLDLFNKIITDQKLQNFKVKSEIITNNKKSLNWNLTTLEKNYLRSQEFNICSRFEHYPLSAVKDNKLVGIGGDLFDLINQQLQIKYNIIESRNEKDFNRNMNSNNCDMVITISKDQKQYKNYLTTFGLYQNQFVSIGNIDSFYIDDYTDFTDHTFYVKEQFHKDIFDVKYKGIDVRVAKDIDRIFDLIEENKNIHFLNILIPAEHQIQKYGPSKFKINGRMTRVNLPEGSIGVHSKHLLLLSALNKSIHNIDKQKVNEIIQKYEIKEFVIDNTKEITISALVIGIILITIIFILYQYQLATRLQNQKKELELELEKKLNDIRGKDILLNEQSKMTALGEMMGNIAHQWRQPLASISSASSGIWTLKQMDKLNDDTLKELTDQIVKNSMYLSDTINTFRDFISGEKETKDLPVQNEIKEALVITKAAIENNYIKLIDEVNYEKQFIYHMTKGDLSQIIINLLNNAKDVLLEREIEEAWIKMNLRQTSNFIEFTIEDNGGGIAEGNMSKIFEPYFTTKHKSRGTGLGLSMSYKLATEALNGSLSVQNSQNGAIFTIKLPINTSK